MRTWGLIGVLVLLMASHTRTRVWGVDFWEHSAVVRELAERPWNPSHPLLHLDVPHAFFSPYALALAQVTRLTGIPATTVTAWWGMLNLAALLAGLALLSRELSMHGARASFYAILFVFFLWGARPWRWSGFVHFYGARTVLPYPSTFSIALVLFSLAAYARSLRRCVRPPHLALAVCGAVVWLSHPVTALAYVTGLVAFHVSSTRCSSTRETLSLLMTVGAAIAGAMLWPYYDFVDLVLNEREEFESTCVVFYQDVWVKIWPIFVAAPLLLLRHPRAPWRDPLLWWCGMLAAIYAVGAWQQSYGAGRVIAFMAMSVQLGLADVVSRAEARLASRWRGGNVVFPLAVVCALISLPTPFVEVLRASDPRRGPETHPTEIVAGEVGREQVVFSDMRSSFEIPAFAGRIVASPHPLYWVRDHDDRRRDVARFFEHGVASEEREKILTRWQASYVLFDRSRAGAGSEDEVAIIALGRVVAQHGEVVLLRLPRGEKEAVQPR